MALGQGLTMLRQPYPAADGVSRLLEELYLDTANRLAADEYTHLSENEKRATLVGFAKMQAATSKRWSRILQDLLSADLDGWRETPVTIAAPPMWRFASTIDKAATPIMVCPKCSQLAAQDRGVIADETVYHCKPCNLYAVENGPRWVKGGPYLASELRIIAELRDRDATANR
jgi:hypothetical protein